MQINYYQMQEGINAGIYRKLGAGSGRYVYDMGNGYVIKYARNRKGFAQNEEENEIFHIRHDPIFAIIVGLSEDSRILVMEKAEPYYTSKYICQYYDISNLRELLQIHEIRRLVYDYHLVGADLTKLSSWGEARNRPVLLDYGFTTQVRNRYYNGLF